MNEQTKPRTVKAVKITKKMVTDGVVIETGFNNLKEIVFPGLDPESQQHKDLRAVFYAGARFYSFALTKGVDDVPTVLGDFALTVGLERELQKFMVAYMKEHGIDHNTKVEP